jgi:hypothetical protein
VLYSCYYDNEEYLYPSLSHCDTTSITFTVRFIRLYGSIVPDAIVVDLRRNVALTNYQTISSTAANGSLFGVIMVLLAFLRCHPMLSTCLSENNYHQMLRTDIPIIKFYAFTSLVLVIAPCFANFSRAQDELLNELDQQTTPTVAYTYATFKSTRGLPFIQ